MSTSMVENYRLSLQWPEREEKLRTVREENEKIKSILTDEVWLSRVLVKIKESRNGKPVLHQYLVEKVKDGKP